MAEQMTLEEKLTAILMVDDTGRGPVGRCSAEPASYNSKLSEFEGDLRDWGLVYGMAFGLARMEEPCESMESVADRALIAARAAYKRYGGEISERHEPGPLVAAVLRAYDEVEPMPSPRKLDDALHALLNGMGVPA